MAMEFLQPPSEEILLRVRNEFGLNEHRIKEAVEILKNWLELQPHLPKENDDGRLERWIIRCKNKIEKAKRTLDMYYTVRTISPELMTGWDVNGDWFNVATESFLCVTLPQLTPEVDRVIVTCIRNTNTADFNLEHIMKLTLLNLEIRMCEDYCISDIYIMDFSNFVLGHVPKISLPLLKKYEVCLMGGYNIKLKAVHFVNVPPIALAVIEMVKTVFGPKLRNRIHVHGSDLTLVHQQIPKYILPTEYGGEAGSLDENWDRCKKKIQSYHGWFLEQEKLKSIESNRIDKSVKSSDILGFEGTFRKLNVD